MKRIFTTIIVLALALLSFAQVPQTVNFSAVVRDADNNLLANTPVNVRLTFFEGSDHNSPVYCALHQTTTNANGFMSFQLNRNVLAYACNGAPNTPFEDIPWENGNYWMQVEYQAQIGADFINLGYLELTSNFYSFVAENAITAQNLEGFELSIAEPHDGDVLTYNASTGKWEARPAGSGSGSGSGYNDVISGTAGGHDYVDLGLPSGLKWATCNIGANGPVEYGNYYAWGETSPKTDYSSETYTYSDNPTTLPASADAATVNWGNGWRMPTKEEFEELINNCTCQYVTRVDNFGYGVTGYRFTGPNGNVIFLPAAGYRDGTSLCDAGSGGYYWSSSLNSDGTGSAWLLDFDSGNYGMNYYYRGYGQSVRPVRQ